MFKARKYLSGAEKRKRRKEKAKKLATGKRTLEDLGWGIKKFRADIIDEISTDDSEQSMDGGNSQNIITADTASTIASSSSDDSNLVVSASIPSSNMASFCTSDPATWRQLSSADRESIVHNGPPKAPSSFPYDTKGRMLPDSIFTKTLPNGETVSRDWLVWSQSKHALFCFPCCLLNKHSTLEQHQVQESLSKLARTNADITNNWRKLYTKIHSHECNSAHLSYYCDWKAMEKSLQKCTGIDNALQKQIVEQISQ